MLEKRIIKFDEPSHTYTDEFDLPYTSVTQLISTRESKFDTPFWSMYRAIDQIASYKPRPFPEEQKIELTYLGVRRQYQLSTLYLGIVPLLKSPEEIRTEWQVTTEEACEWGHNKHSYLEGCVDRFASTRSTAIHEMQESISTRGFSFKVMNVQQLEQSPLQFTYPAIYRELELLVKGGWALFAEKRVYDSEYRIAGTIDLLAIKGGKAIIIDWKTNRKKLKFTSGYYKKEWNAQRTAKYETDQWVATKAVFLDPLKFLSHCKGNVYALQLSLYHYLCERWGFPREATTLVHIRPKCTPEGEIMLDETGDRIEMEPEFYDMPYLRREVSILTEWHKSQLSYAQCR